MDSVRDGRPPGGRGGVRILGTGIRPMARPRSVRRRCLRLCRDEVDECACSLSEISSLSVPSACRRSTRAFLISIDCAEQLLAPLLLGFSFRNISNGVRTPWMVGPYTFVVHTLTRCCASFRLFCFFVRLSVSSCS